MMRTPLLLAVAVAMVLPLAVFAEPTLDDLYGSMDDLERAEERYRRIASEGGWPSIPSGEVLEPEARGDAVATLIERLRFEDEDLPAGDVYTPAVESSVRKFQRRHGLLVDGLAGPQTIAALNVSAERRAQELAQTLERRLALEQREPPPAVIVNLPEQRLHAFEDGERALTMAVVVGEPAWETPTMRETMEHVIVNPYWNVPVEILVADILPELRKNPSYLAENDMEVVAEPGPRAESIDPSTVDWSAIDADDPSSFPYVLRQKPGPENPLGRIKFMMPNREDIYLHDTPADQLFEEPMRARSHGCIRLERPLDFADWVLRDVPQWDRAAVDRQIESEEYEVILLKRDAEESAETEEEGYDATVTVDLVYWTAWVDAEGIVHFREDLYDLGGAPDAETSQEPKPTA